MIEAIAMLTVLAGMGVYFVKSADLSQDLKERSAQLKYEVHSIPQKNKFAHLSNINRDPKNSDSSLSIETNLDNEVLRELIAKEQQRQANVEIINKEIDDLTQKLTSLELEINSHRTRLQTLQITRIS